ncbi:MAG: PEP-CTERM-box response regulator transcription factor [Candidatus Omnitrophota bacterium]
MEKPKILIVDDEEGIRRQLCWALKSEYEVLQAQDKDGALRLVEEQKPDLVALDVNLTVGSDDNKDGMMILSEILSLEPRTKVIMVTANDDKDNMLEAVRNGAYDYYIKPINLEEIKVIFKRALYIQELERENERLSSALREKKEFNEIIGSCAKMQEVFSVIRKVAPTDVTVLINGESGTGKELVARAIHYSSLRKDKPLMVINCGAIPENLLESELFGHEKGSFTDAYSKKIGKFELANTGTIFLDEIGELSLALQVKLLRFLQERVIERVGGNEQIELDVRIIAATNSDLKQRMKENAFREDLYYRLSVVNIGLPALRERDEDIELLANYCLHNFNRECNKKIKGFSKEAIKAINSYSWPGNVRELENKIKRAVILSNNHIITPQDLGLEIDSNEHPKLLKEAREQLEIKLIKEALIKNKGNISRAAREIGINRVSFYDLMKKYDIDKF